MITDPVSRWRNKLTSSTRETYDYWWGQFLEWCQLKPDQLLALSTIDATDLATDFFNKLIEEGYTSNSAATAYATVRSFFAYNGKTLAKSGDKFRGLTQLESRHDLTQKEVFQITEAIPNFRDKAAAGVIFQGGQRVGIVCALKLKHIQTRDWQQAPVVVFDIPEFMPDHTKRNVNKRKIKYRFGILSDVAAYLRLHLEERERAGERITGESWLFRSRMGNHGKTNYSSTHISSIKRNWLNQCIVNAAKKLGMQSKVDGGRPHPNREVMLFGRYAIHAHCGREYFKRQTRLSDVDPDLRNFMIGHKLPFGDAYDRFNETEIVKAMDKARARLALTPEPADELEKRKQNILDAVKLLKMTHPEGFEDFKVSLTKASTSEAIEQLLETFNGKRRLRKMKVK